MPEDQDVLGRPACQLVITMGRDIQRQGRVSLIYLLVWLIITGVTFTIVVLIFMEKLLLTPLGILSAGVERIGHTANLDDRVPAGGGDELATLAGAINNMLEAGVLVAHGLSAPTNGGTAGVILSASKERKSRWNAGSWRSPTRTTQ